MYRGKLKIVCSQTVYFVVSSSRSQREYVKKLERMTLRKDKDNPWPKINVCEQTKAKSSGEFKLSMVSLLENNIFFDP